MTHTRLLKTQTQEIVGWYPDMTAVIWTKVTSLQPGGLATRHPPHCSCLRHPIPLFRVEADKQLTQITAGSPATPRGLQPEPALICAQKTELFPPSPTFQTAGKPRK